MENQLVLSALISYGFGSIMAACAGIVGPTLTRKILESDENTKIILNQIFMNNYLLNQAFSKVFVVAVGFALIAWSICLLKQGRLMKVTALIGFVFASLSILRVLSK